MAIGRKYERDIDLMLAEEFMVSEPFANWFLEKTKFAGLKAKVEDVFVSKSEAATGESDLVVIYKDILDSKLFAIHIEDKIDAPLQPEQGARYHQRAKSDVKQGVYNDFEIVLCAPEFYRDNQPKSVHFEIFISYENISKFIGEIDSSARGQYRSNFIATSTSRRINSWQRVDDDQTNLFWAEVYKIASHDFPILEMKELQLTKGSTWVNFRPHSMPTMPRRIYVSFKGDRGYMDLTFSSCIAHKLKKQIQCILEPNMTVHQTGKSTAIRLSVDGITVNEPIEMMRSKIPEALAACEKLVNFFSEHRETLMKAIELITLEPNNITVLTTTNQDELNRFRGCLIGLAVGDAVGTTVEFNQRGTFPLVTDMTGGGPFKLKPGQWTDDTSMALCLATSLIECSQFNAEDQMQRYSRWQDEGYLSSNGLCFDIGNTVRNALRSFQQTGNPFSGSTLATSAGNGCLMRLAPVPMFFYPDRDAAILMSGESSRTTHGAVECIEASQLFGAMLFMALSGATKEDILLAHDVTGLKSKGIAAIANGAYKGKPMNNIRGSGYVVESLEAALWCFYHTDTFQDAILKAANLGNDADTTAAICGQISGAYYGEPGIPDHWKNRLTMIDEIRTLAGHLHYRSLTVNEMKKCLQISDLFCTPPNNWGLRGDPHLWNEMQTRFIEVNCPKLVEELVMVINAMFDELTGFPITHQDSIYIERYNHGGMSSGMVFPEFWRETAIPLLSERLNMNPSFKQMPNGIV